MSPVWVEATIIILAFYLSDPVPYCSWYGITSAINTYITFCALLSMVEQRLCTNKCKKHLFCEKNLIVSIPKAWIYTISYSLYSTACSI